MYNIEYFNSAEFQAKIRAKIEADTWGKGHPMYYMDADGWLVKHWKNGKIIKLKKLK